MVVCTLCGTITTVEQTNKNLTDLTMTGNKYQHFKSYVARENRLNFRTQVFSKNKAVDDDVDNDDDDDDVNLSGSWKLSTLPRSGTTYIIKRVM